MSRPAPTPKRARSSREPYKAPRDRRELFRAVAAGAAVVLVTIGAVLFLGRDELGGGSSTTPPAPAPIDTSSTVPATAPSTPGATTAPAGGEPAPASGATTPSTLPGAPTG